jgi:hypothetical protein
MLEVLVLQINMVTCRGLRVRDLQDEGFYWMIGFIAPYTFTTREYRQYIAITGLHTLQFTATHPLGFCLH